MPKISNIKKGLHPNFNDVKTWYNDNLQPSKIDFNDLKPYEVYEKGKFAGIFQCVSKDTKVLLANGLTKKICKIKVGDIVSTVKIPSTINCENELLVTSSQVLAVYEQGEKLCIKIYCKDNTTIICTVDHPILIQNSKYGNTHSWKEAGLLCVGDTVCVVKDNVATTTIIQKIEPAGKHEVYDIEINEYHNFIANGIVVHNCTGAGAQKLFMTAKPKSIIDIAALTSIYRPGPLAANVDKLWLKHETEPYDWGHPLVNEVLSDTRGCLIFQEQILFLANKVGGFPKEQTDEVRRAIMKRSVSNVAEANKKAKELEDTFVDGAIKNGVAEETAHKIYKDIIKFASYGFNKSLHSEEKIDVYNNDGTYKETKCIKDILPGEFVKSREEKTGCDIIVKVKNKHNHGKLNLVKVTLKNGVTVRCTINHKFRVVETNEMLPLWLIIKNGYSIVCSNNN